MAIFFHGGSIPLLLSVAILLSFSAFLSSSSSLLPHQRHLLQANSPQNIETFFPTFSIPALPSETPSPSSSPPPLNAPTPTSTPPPPTATSSRAVAKAVAVTAASTLVFAGLFFFFLQRCGLARRRKHKMEKTAEVISSPRRDEEMAVSYDAFKLVNGALKGLVVDENGLDVLYWRQLERGGDGRRVFRKEVLDGAPRREKSSGGGGSEEGFDRPRREKRDGRGRAVSHANSYPITRIPSNSLSAASSSKISLSEIQPQDRLRSTPHRLAAATDGAEASSTPKAENPLPPPPHVPVKEASDPLPAPPTPQTKNPSPSPPPPPPLPEKKNPAPPPPPPPAPPVKKNAAVPPPPPLPVRKNPPPPPLPPRPASLRRLSSSKGRLGSISSSGGRSKKVAQAAASSSSSKEKEVGPQTKLKPLHWDKLTANAEHSMVWDKIGNGSFQ